MKNLLIICLLVMFLATCVPPRDSQQKENIAVVEKYLAAVQSNDVETMGSLLADNYIGYGPSIGDSINKENALANWVSNAENLYESLDYSMSEKIATTVAEGPAKGDWVSNWAYVTIKYKNREGPVNLWLNAVYKIENGKIARSRTFYNEADVMEQLGYVFLPPEAF